MSSLGAKILAIQKNTDQRMSDPQQNLVGGFNHLEKY
jgi:hypothetical protein